MWWLLKRNRMICPSEVAVNDQFFLENRNFLWSCLKKSKFSKIYLQNWYFFTRIQDPQDFKTRLTPLITLNFETLQSTPILPPSIVHGPATSFHPNIAQPFCNFITIDFAKRSIALAVQPLWNKVLPVFSLLSDPSYKLTKTSPLAIFPEVIQ